MVVVVVVMVVVVVVVECVCVCVRECVGVVVGVGGGSRVVFCVGNSSVCGSRNDPQLDMMESLPGACQKRTYGQKRGHGCGRNVFEYCSLLLNDG